MEVIIELLDKNHDRTAFDCGVEELNQFLKKICTLKSKKQFK